QVFKVPGEQILYIGDHVYTDVRVSKAIRRWRTALILRELEEELNALASIEATQGELGRLMAQKTELEAQLSEIRLAMQRKRLGYGPEVKESIRELDAEFSRNRAKAIELDELIGPLAKVAGEVHNQRWGLLMRAGNDKSHMARHVERHADVYTSRVSNFLVATPFVYLRSMRGSLPHDP
ncbi:MAG: HAD family hydrolase, partial [Myxococcales bacterium]|nr:HAD family hydrolase [Myxococcales bacterium]